MVEISLSGSGEGPGWVTSRGYSTVLIPHSHRPTFGAADTRPCPGLWLPNGYSVDASRESDLRLGCIAVTSISLRGEKAGVWDGEVNTFS